MRPEVYKKIVGFESYEISNYGNVRHFKKVHEVFITKSIDTSGYYFVNLFENGNKKTISIHKLVAIYFLNHVPNGMKLVINHKDFNRKNNYVYNLEIISNRENTNQKHLKSTSVYTGVSLCKTTKTWISSIKINGKSVYLGRFKNEYDASLAYEDKLSKIKKIK
jgi:hypothetical protein